MENPTYLDKNTVLFVREYAVSGDRLWQAVSQQDELSIWFMETNLELRIDGKYEFKDGWNGWIGDLREPDFIQFNSSNESFTRFVLKPGATGTELHLIDRLPPDISAPPDNQIQNQQPGGKGTHWVGLLAGWHDFLEALKSYLAGEKIEDNYETLCMQYSNFLQKKYP